LSGPAREDLARFPVPASVGRPLHHEPGTLPARRAPVHRHPSIICTRKEGGPCHPGRPGRDDRGDIGHVVPLSVLPRGALTGVSSCTRAHQCWGSKNAMPGQASLPSLSRHVQDPCRATRRAPVTVILRPARNRDFTSGQPGQRSPGSRYQGDTSVPSGAQTARRRSRAYRPDGSAAQDVTTRNVSARGWR